MTSLQDLVTSMNGYPSTNQWDIVCSYTVLQLNQFLQAQYDAGKLAKEVSLSTKRQDPLTGTDFTISYDIQFASPQLDFITGRSGFSTLTMLIKDGSSYSVKVADKPTRTVSIPGGKYSVKAVVPLAAIRGDTGEIKEQGNIIKFSDGESHDNHVIIHFKNKKGASYKIVPEPDPQDKDTLATYFLPLLNHYFSTEIKEIDYALSTVNNSQPPSGLSVFTPKSFAFASMGNEDGDSGVLSLYIQTSESNNPPGNASPSFQPGDKQVFPIPESYTASIILSYDLITKAFLKPQIEKSGFTVSFYTVSDGISAKLTKDSSVVALGDEGHSIIHGYSYGELNITLKDYPLNLVIKQGKLSLQWQGKATAFWSEAVSVGRSGSAHYGSVDITIDLNKEPINLSLSNENAIIADIAISRSDFSIDVKAKKCKAGDILCEEACPPHYSNDMQLSIPSMNLALHGFDFFRTTNLIAPEKHIIEVDANAGISTPHDFLIVGKVATQ